MFTGQYSNILGDPGELVLAGKGLNGPEKKFGRGKVKNAKKSPWGQGLTDLFQRVGVVLASD